MAYPAAMEQLVQELERLPGIGPRTAERLAFHLVRREGARTLAQALTEAAEQVRPCEQCLHLTDRATCAICDDESRDRSRILIVEQPKDLESMEKAGWQGLYHVLLGSLSGTDAARPGGPAERTLEALAKRLRSGDVREVVLGTNPDLEGDGTAMIVTEFVERVSPRRIVVSRLARGMPTGGAIEYTNAAVLAEAIEERRPLEGTARGAEGEG